MLFEHKGLSVIAKLFSLIGIIPGFFLVYNGVPSGWFFLILGVIVFGFRFKKSVNEEAIMSSVFIYNFPVWSKTLGIEELKSILLEVVAPVNINATSSTIRSFGIVFEYKYPERFFRGDYDAASGVEISSFIPSRFTRLNKKNYEYLLNNYLIKLSKMTGLPIKYSNDISEDYGSL